MRAVKVTSVKELVTKLGGPTAASKVLGTTPQNVVNWRTVGKIPPRFHLVHRKLLAPHGLQVDDTCWGFDRVAG